MKIKNNHILVSVDVSQRDKIKSGENELFSARRYSDNWREKTPVIAKVIDGNNLIEEDRWLICDYNLFDIDSPYEIVKGEYVIPFDDSIIAIVLSDGELMPINGNFIVSRETKPTVLELPPDLTKPQIDRVIIEQDAYGFKKGQLAITYQYGNYEIVYEWNGDVKRAVKVNIEDIIGIVK